MAFIIVGTLALINIQDFYSNLKVSLVKNLGKEPFQAIINTLSKVLIKYFFNRNGYRDSGKIKTLGIIVIVKILF